MHEVSLVAELVEACERVAAGAPVQAVRVRHASAIPEDVVRQAFAMLTTGTPLGAARFVLFSQLLVTRLDRRLLFAVVAKQLATEPGELG